MFMRSSDSASTPMPASVQSAWRCAAVALAVLSGSVAVNLAGCGGGGGGSGGGIAGVSNPNITFQLVDASGNTTNGTVNIGTRTVTSAGGSAVFTNLAPGTYNVTFVVGGVSTTARVVVGSETRQNFELTVGNSTVGGARGISVSGLIQLNTGSASSNNCTSASAPVTAALLVRVVRLGDVSDTSEAIVASVTKPDQAGSSAAQQGRYIVSNLPRAGTYRVEVRQVPGATAPFSGRSPSFTISTGQTSATANVCANASNSSPGDLPPSGGTPITPTSGTPVTPTSSTPQAP